MTAQRDSISRLAFAEAVRASEDRQREAGDHHPRPGVYDPAAFRHYIRERALLGVLAELRFETALDVGCSEGYFMKVIADRTGAEVWGVDIAPAALRKARRLYGQPVGGADAQRLPFADGSFDLVLSTETLEHVLDPDIMIAEMRRVSRGHVVITTPVSGSSDAHEPDYALEAEGHVNNFDAETIRRLIGPGADIRSFRCNATLALIVALASRLPPSLREGLYSFDGVVSRTLGSATHPFAPLRNRDWLILAPGGGSTAGSPGWRCPVCREGIAVGERMAICEPCGVTYAVQDEIPDLFCRANA